MNEIVGPIIGVIVGGICFYAAIHGILKGLESEKWPTAFAKIVDIKIEPSTALYFGDGITDYTFIRFGFNYGDQYYISENIDAMGSTYTRIPYVAQKFIKKYSLHETVVISVCIDDPSKSVLIPGVPKQYYFALLFGGFLLIAGLYKLINYFITLI